MFLFYLEAFQKGMAAPAPPRPKDRKIQLMVDVPPQPQTTLTSKV